MQQIPDSYLVHDPVGLPLEGEGILGIEFFAPHGADLSIRLHLALLNQGFMAS